MKVDDLISELGGYVLENKIYVPDFGITGIPMCNISILVRRIYENGRKDGREKYIDRMIDLFKTIK